MLYHMEMDMLYDNSKVSVGRNGCNPKQGLFIGYTQHHIKLYISSLFLVQFVLMHGEWGWNLNTTGNLSKFNEMLDYIRTGALFMNIEF